MKANTQKEKEKEIYAAERTLMRPEHGH